MIAAAAAALLVVLGTGRAEAIVGPSSEASGEAAGIVMVLNHSGRTAGFCTGVVIAPDVIMTAAHCVPEGADLRVHYPGPGQNPVLLPVEAVARHPDYRPDAIRTRERSIDLAIIRLSAPLPDRFTPMRLSATDGVKPGLPFTMTGYGVTREGDGSSSGRPRRTTLQARAPLSGVLLWAEDSARHGSGACTGDSGAPVMAEGSTTVTALVLWSAGRAGRQCGDLTQALWLGPQKAWIDQILISWGVAPAF
ncbi:S1 family peptidase [Lichenifustis flavocetrariae]|uniref:Trypsin-like serine protease n=1 Tax=Lichenifustis flavocetrariae TaxID=2949735 RepID=A0AA42CPH9_9HYPH|nr:trypsin-like serine protease [Lichenifustis flavocetrariae]MCW6510427.1 trypsin-like serine protease [Lichenifustis flavocetrariae]